MEDYESQLKNIRESENSLEAIVIPITINELLNPRFKDFIQQFKRLFKKYNLDLLFVFNKPIKNKIYINDINIISDRFNKVECIYLNLNKEEDSYISLNEYELIKYSIQLPKYGLTSGPNIMFFKCMEICKKYNTVLLLETDCMLLDGWLDRCIQYVNNVGFFLISGAMYDGLGAGNIINSGFLHKNGVAFYKTGSSTFHNLIKNTKDFIIEKVKTYPTCPYDVLITEMVIDKIKLKQDYYYWRYVFRNIITNSLNINLSPGPDVNINKIIIKNMFPSAVIIHSKSIT